MSVAEAATPLAPLLDVQGLRAYYGEIEALHGIDLRVGTGELVVVLGANGAGKSTTLLALCQAVRTTGTITFDGVPASGRSTADLVRRGMSLIPQNRGTLTELTVHDNLRAGAFVRRDRAIAEDIDFWYETFPRLAERRKLVAGGLSGGEQQMLAIARAMMARPRLLLLDEPSLGLAPLIVARLFEVLATVVRERGTAAVVVEQNASLALSMAARGYVLEAGTVALEGPAERLRDDDGIRRAYLGY